MMGLFVVIPDGWVLVPQEPTEEMQRAGDLAGEDRDGGFSVRGSKVVFTAMIRAAPLAPGKKD